MNFKNEIAKIINTKIDLPITELEKLIEIPTVSERGDYALPCFRFSKELKKSPQIIATGISSEIVKPDFIDKIEAAGGYINFFVNKKVFAQNYIEKVLEQKEHFGESQIGEGKIITMDFSSPNVAKNFHVGHLRTTVIGNSLYKIFKSLGYNPISINHLGDWGTQFGKLITAFNYWGNEEEVNKNGISELTRIYVKFHAEAEKNPALEDEARLNFVKMQQGDEYALKIWKWFCDLSLVEFNRIYEILNIEFDATVGESFYVDKMDAVVDELKAKNILEESQGALVVNLDEHNMPPCLIIRTDGGTLYATRDIAAAMYRKKKYDFYKSIYVTALDQNLYFSQFFKVIEIMGYEWAKDLVHVPYGLVNLEAGKIGTRSGNVVLMEDLLNESIDKILQIINDKNPNLPDKELVAKQVGVGAVIFNDLYNSRIKDVLFSWEKVLNFDGETGPYVQYTYARAASVLRKAPDFDTQKTTIDYTELSGEDSIAVCKLISVFPEKIIEAADKYEPFIITRHIVAIAQAYNKFYHNNQIICENLKAKEARLTLTYVTKLVIQKGLSLLGISCPEQM